jgi:HCOMODA/2-hydroxy-3-carboxy-muconic semialdehyde decarboxylase
VSSGLEVQDGLGGFGAGDASGQRSEVAEAANVLARLGLVTAYGHVSARAGEAMLITPAGDLADVTASAVLEVPLTASPPLPAGVPAEGWAHLALYRARPDAAAIARAQPVTGFGVAATTPSLVPLHGQAAWLGESVPVHDSAVLLRSPELAERAARTLPAGEALLLRGNGAITLGAAPGLAVARMWILAAACEIYLAARGVREIMGTGFGTPYSVTPLSADEIASWRAVGDELLPRLWQHLRRR